MADILAAFDELENEERAQKTAAQRNERNAKGRKGSHSSGRSGRPRSRTSNKASNSLPPPVIGTGRLTPIPPKALQTLAAEHPPNSRESSRDDGRRISFAEPQRPQARRLYIATKTASLASGFPYTKKLLKYGVMQSEWEAFSEEVVEAANVPPPIWAWFMHRKEVMRKIKKELQYEGDFKRVLRKWNKHFKVKGFQAWLELPIAKGEPIRSQSADPEDSSDEDKEKAKRDEKKNSKRFRMVVSSNVEKGSSVYSRTSSLTRSVSGEGFNMSQKAAQKAHEKATEHAAQQDEDEDEKEVKDVKDETATKDEPPAKEETVTKADEKDVTAAKGVENEVPGEAKKDDKDGTTEEVKKDG